MRRAEIQAGFCPLCQKVLGENWAGRNGLYYHSGCAQLVHSRQPRACVGCGHVRVVLVRFDPVDQHESFNKHCGACAAEERSAHYARESKRFAVRAALLKARQLRGTK